MRLRTWHGLAWHAENSASACGTILGRASVSPCIPLNIRDAPASAETRTPMLITSPDHAKTATPGKSQPSVAEWKTIVAEFQQSSTTRAAWQLVNTFGPYALVWYLMYLSVAVSWWLTLPLAILAGGLLVRIFIIFHDCGHGSFFKSRRANDLTGFIAGMLNFTPYYHWRWEHAVHHASSGDLDRRGTGDVWTMTVKEYRASSRWRRLGYRVVRHPLVLLFVAPFYLFVVRERFATKGASLRDRQSVWWMNAAILSMIVALSFAFGLKNYLKKCGRFEFTTPKF